MAHCYPLFTSWVPVHRFYLSTVWLQGCWAVTAQVAVSRSCLQPCLTQRMQIARIDVRNYHANASSHRSVPIDQLYRRNESSKKQSYWETCDELWRWGRTGIQDSSLDAGKHDLPKNSGALLRGHCSFADKTSVLTTTLAMIVSFPHWAGCVKTNQDSRHRSQYVYKVKNCQSINGTFVFSHCSDAN